LRWKHLDETGYTYFEHMQRAFGFGVMLLKGACCSFIHGFIPDVYCDAATRIVEELNEHL